MPQFARVSCLEMWGSCPHLFYTCSPRSAFFHFLNTTFIIHSIVPYNIHIPLPIDVILQVKNKPHFKSQWLCIYSCTGCGREQYIQPAPLRFITSVQHCGRMNDRFRYKRTICVLRPVEEKAKCSCESWPTVRNMEMALSSNMSFYLHLGIFTKYCILPFFLRSFDIAWFHRNWRSYMLRTQSCLII
jgi:hypothetical protein